MRTLLTILLALGLWSRGMGQIIINDSWNNQDTIPAGNLIWVDVDFTNAVFYNKQTDSIQLVINNPYTGINAIIFKQSWINYVSLLPKSYNGDTIIRIYSSTPASFPIGDFILTPEIVSAQGSIGCYCYTVSGVFSAPVTGITAAQQTTTKTVIARYNLMGQPIQAPEGIYIECYSDGTREKKGIIQQ